MKLIGVSMVMNEADVIELFVRHHLQILDHFVVCEHASSDATPEILGELAQELPGLEVVTDPRPQLDQAVVTTRLMRHAVEDLHADWVIPLDADEFLTSDVDPSVRPIFEKLDATTAHRVPWRTYVPLPSDLADEPSLLRRTTHRRQSERRPKWKVLVPGELARSTTMTAGNHGLEDARGRVIKGEKIESGLQLAHFPVRSAEQVAAKGLAGWVSMAASAHQTGKMGWHVKLLFDRLRTGEPLSAEEVSELAIAYHQQPGDDDPDRALVRDPVPDPVSPVVLKRPGQPRAPVIQLLADVAERIALELSEERRNAQGAPPPPPRKTWWQRLRGGQGPKRR